MNHVRIARRVIALLRPLIEQAQGTLTITPEQWPQAAVPAAAPINTKPPSQWKHESGTIHLALFTMLLVKSLTTCFDLVFHGMAVMLIAAAVVFTVAALTVIALVRQHNSDLPVAVRRLVLGSLGLICFYMACGYVRTIILVIQNPSAANDQLEMLRLVANASPLESTWLTVLYLVSATTSLVLGTTGLLLVRRFRNQPQPAAPPVITG